MAVGSTPAAGGGGVALSSVSKTFTHADFTEATDSTDSVAFDDAIPAGAVGVKWTAACSVGFSGGSASAVFFTVANSNVTLNTAIQPRAFEAELFDLTGGAAQFPGLYGGILENDTPVVAIRVIGDVPSSLTAGSVTVTIYYLTS